MAGIEQKISLIDDWVIHFLASNQSHLAIPHSCLYTLRSPDFELKHCKPLSFMAIGSGMKATDSVEAIHANLIMQNSVAAEQDAHWFRHSVSRFAELNNIATVGGLYPMLRVWNRQIGYIGQGETLYATKDSIVAKVSLKLLDGRWHQIGYMTGTQVPLLYPWELDSTLSSDRRFDEHDRRRWMRRPTT